jgi:hypothetical protein
LIATLEQGRLLAVLLGMGNSGMTAVTMPKWWGKYSGKRKKEGEGKGKDGNVGGEAARLVPFNYDRALTGDASTWPMRPGLPRSLKSAVVCQLDRPLKRRKTELLAGMQLKVEKTAEHAECSDMC